MKNKYKEFEDLYEFTGGRVLLTWCPKNSWKDKYPGSWYYGFDLEYKIYKCLYVRFFGYELTIS